MTPEHEVAIYAVSVFRRFLALSRLVSNSCHSPSRVDRLVEAVVGMMVDNEADGNTYPVGSDAIGASCLK
jgi:hypothetical protein